MTRFSLWNKLRFFTGSARTSLHRTSLHRPSPSRTAAAARRRCLRYEGLEDRTLMAVAPVAVADAYNVAEDAELSIPAVYGVLANDTDADQDPLTATLVSDVQHGSLTLNANGSFTYTPNGDFSGRDSFTYKANDGALDSDTVTVTLNVVSINDAPVGVDDSYMVSAYSYLFVDAPGVLANDCDVDDPDANLMAILTSDPSLGYLMFNTDGSFIYVPYGITGDDSFSYVVFDGESYSEEVDVRIFIV